MNAPVDWDFAQKVAAKVADRDHFAGGYQYEILRRDFVPMTAQAEELVGLETGLVSLEGNARARVADRPMWIRANVASFQRMMKPLSESLGLEEVTGIKGDVTRKIGGSQIGFVLGWMATRVLGQYDLLLTEDENPQDQDIVYYVGPNVLNIEEKFDFDPKQFRLWLALHECTHRAQFTGVPWLRDHFLSLVNQTLENVDPDPGRMMSVVQDLIEARKNGEDPLADGGFPMLFASEEQKAVLDQVMGMMSLLEGHGDITMDRAGEAYLPDAPRMAAKLRERRESATGLTKVMMKVLGIEAKMNQYALGEGFIEEIEKEGGRDMINIAWSAAEFLPSMAEIRNPKLWLERVPSSPPAAAAAAAAH